MKPKDYSKRAIRYAEDVVARKIIIGEDAVNACRRFLSDLEREDLEFRTTQPNAACAIMEGLLVHRKGEALDGTPLMGKPFILEDWQVFVVYNLLGFWKTGTEERRFKEAFIEVARKNGKALALDTPIPTPEGWKTMSDIHPGSYVYGKDGKPVRVIVESEIFHKPMYAVTFEDGDVIEASADHVWTVKTKKSRQAYKDSEWRSSLRCKPEYRVNCGWFEKTTEEIALDFVHDRRDKKGREFKYRVPMQNAVIYEDRSLPIHPYVLGVWLGDGTSTDTIITCGKDDIHEMVRNIEACGYPCKIYRYYDRADSLGICKGEKGQKNPFRDALRDLGVFGNKHIPDVYMFSSIEQRMELLRGLMDTDGFCEKRGQCEFSQKSEPFVDQFRELLSSLGIKSSKREKSINCNGKKCRAFSVLFYCDKTNPCFKLTRKSNRLKDHLSARMDAKSIVNVERIVDKPSKCIAVDADDHLYLCGKSYTPTHNTSMIAALALAVSIIQRKSGSTVYVVAAALKQALETFQFLEFSLRYKGLKDKFDVHDNNFDHSIKYTFTKDGKPDGTIDIQVLASNPDAQDSFNCNFAIADEVAAYKKPAQYNRFKEAQAAYTNRLMVGITTAGDNINSFGYRRMEYACKVASGQVQDDSLFSFVCRADVDDKGICDYTNPIQHQKANPSYGVTIRPQDIMNDALQAQNDPQQRKDFLSRRLNVYTSSMRAYFDIDEFRASDGAHDWTLRELAKLPVDWYGGADLSRMHDLTAVALFGQYEGTDIIITHAFFPAPQAAAKADEDNIPLFDWLDNDWLTLCNAPTVNMGDVVNWFVGMRKKGFHIAQVGHDRKFAGEEYFPLMKQAGFVVVDQPQLYFLKSRGFRHIERAAKNGKLFYCHSRAYEYCLSNVRAVEKEDDAIQYSKIMPEQRIDLFDASVFACIRCLEAGDKKRKAQKWFGIGEPK